MVTACGYQKFEVRMCDSAYGVDLLARRCACRMWQLTGIPCVHAMAAIANMNQDAEAFVSSSFTKEAFLRCYQYSINPVNGSDMWPDVPYDKPLPPKRRRLPGRPTVKRRRDAGEREMSSHTVTKRGTQIRCSICKVTGHNKKSCQSNPRKNSSGIDR